MEQARVMDITNITLAVSFIGFVTLIVYSTYKNRSTINLPPTYGGWIPWLGCAVEFGKCPLYFIEEYRKKLGPVFTLKVAGSRMTFLTDHEDHKYFFTSSSVDFQEAVKQPVQNTGSIPPDSFDVNHTKMHDVVKWRLGQSHLSPHCQNLGKKFNEGLNTWGDNGSDDLASLVRRTMYKAVIENLFGDHVLPCSPEDAFMELEKHFVKFDADFEYAARLPPIFLREWNASKWWLLNIFKVAVHKLRANASTGDQKTLFASLVETVKGPHAANFGMLMMWASLANAIPITFWTLGFITTSPDVYTKVKEEIEQAHKTKRDNGSDIDLELTQDDLGRFPYIRRCMMESIRLRSPGVIARGVKESLQIKDYTIPAGNMLMLSPYWAHRNPVYFPQPESFNPDRWLKADLDRNMFLDGFVAFGGGRYQCPGRWFALMEMHLLLVLLLTKYHIKPLDPLPQHSPLHVVGTQQPETPMTVEYTRIH